jgi:hypothetical protein
MDFKNIVYNKDVLTSEKAHVHLENLKIAQVNLEDFNSRLQESIVLKYNGLRFKFEKSNNHQKTYEIEGFINLFTMWSKNLSYGFQDFYSTFFKKIEYEYNQIVQDYRGRYVLKKITNRDIEIFNSDREVFIRKYHNYSPLGFLSNEQENEIKLKINKLFIDPIKNEY